MGITPKQAHVLAHLDDVRGQLMMYGHRNYVKWKLDGKDVSSIINSLQRKGLVIYPKAKLFLNRSPYDRRVEHHPNALLNILEGYGSGRKRNTAT
jgi:DNA-binding MarR family transcriptional regulator